ncbi:MAG: hypothetical protein GW949_09465 [Spirochaetales bacterium]|nr:hypothetical protein [Spirochaetales bacterium]
MVHLVSIIDLYARQVLSCRLGNSMTRDFCVEALNETLETYGCPAIFNTDHTGRPPCELLAYAT